MPCSSCGYDNPDGAKFCANCGQELTRACVQCGTPVVENAKFCIECGAPLATEPPAREHGSEPHLDGAERRQLTIMFCDLMDSTRLSTELDPEEVRELNRAYRKLCSERVQRFEGYIARYMGDGVLAYFGYPRAHEDDASRAVRAGLEIAAGAPELARALSGNETVAVRIGIATGPVVVGELIGEGPAQEHDVIGETPNLAARLQGVAPPNAVVVGEQVRKLLGAAFDLEDLGEQRLKGFSEAVRAWRVVDTAAVETRFEASRPAQLTPLIGREHETALILDRWRQAVEGEGQVILLSGEPGIGKSRIVSSVRESLSGEEYVPVRLQCSPYHQNSALYPVVEHLQRAASFVEGESMRVRLDKLEALLELPESDASEAMALFASLLSLSADKRYPKLELDPEVRRERTLELLIAQLESLSRRAPLFFLSEDVHWADPTTLALLNSLVEQVRGWRALVMITYRPEFQAPWAGEAHVSLLSLSRLDRQRCESMIQGLTQGRALPAEIVDEIALKTDGVPLFVEELTKAILESGLVVEQGDHYALSGPMQPLAIPTTLQDSLMARLDQLDEAKSLAQIGAAIGREFPRALLEAVSESQDIEPAVSRLLESGLVFRRGTGTRTTFVFKHALVQDAAYNSMLNSRRHALHARIAEVLLKEFPDVVRTQPERLAQHYAAAGLDEQALPYWRGAGCHAMERSAYEEAISHFRRAVELLSKKQVDAAVAAELVELQTSIAECLRIVDRMDEAFAALRAAEELALQFELKHALSGIHHLRGNLYFPLAKMAECLAEHQSALEYAQAADSVEGEVRALGGLGDAYYLCGRMRTAKHYFGRCVELASQHGFSTTAAANLYMHGFSRAYLFEIRESLQDGRNAAIMAAEAGHPRAEMLAHILMSVGYYHTGELEKAVEECERVATAIQRLGARRFESQNNYYHGLCLYSLGDKQGARDLLDKAEPPARQFNPSFSLARVLGGIALVTDDATRREKALAEAERLLDAGAVSHNHFAFCMDAADSCFDHGEWERMEHYARRLEDYTRKETTPWSDFVISRARVLAQWGRGSRGAETNADLRRLLNQAKQAEFWSSIDRIETALAVVPETGR